MEWLKKLPDCPCKLCKDKDGNWQKPSGNWTNPGKAKKAYHPGADQCIRSTYNKGGPGQQCCYDSDGNLITSKLGAGTPDRVSPEGWIDAARHLFADVQMFDFCRKYLGDQWVKEQYWKVRPPNQGQKCE